MNESDNTEPKKRTFIILKDIPYNVTDIYYYESITEWDYENNCDNYGIKLNETPEEAKKIPLYSNKKIFYDCIEDRDIDIERLKLLFADNNNII